jgi:Cupin-like domain
MIINNMPVYRKKHCGRGGGSRLLWSVQRRRPQLFLVAPPFFIRIIVIIILTMIFAATDAAFVVGLSSSCTSTAATTATTTHLQQQHAFSSRMTTTTTTTRKSAWHVASTAANYHQVEDEKRVNSVISTTGRRTFVVPRISVDELVVDPTRTRATIQLSSLLDRPILLSNAMSTELCEACLDILMAEAGDIVVQVQQQTHSSSSSSSSSSRKSVNPESLNVSSSSSISTHVFPCTLHQAIDVIMTRSSSKQAYLAFCEGLLQQESKSSPCAALSSNVQQHVTSARERAFMSIGHGANSDYVHDWFSQFPTRAQPTDAVIIAGAGATSTLHRDPFEWTGTSLCLEGTKVWRFIEPPPPQGAGGVSSVDEQLNSYRLQSITWHDDDNDDNDTNVDGGEGTSMSLSAGWQSDYSLYHSRRHESIPCARELAELAETDPMRYEKLLNTLATDLNILRPCETVAAQNLTIHTAIQKAGDLLLIPAHWWHQTYAFEPSVAVATQRCSAFDAPRVFEHILRQVAQHSSRRQQENKMMDDVSETVTSILDKASSSQEAIDELFRIVQQHSK